MIKIRTIVIAALLSVLPLATGVAKSAIAGTETGLDAVPVLAPELPELIEFDSELPSHEDAPVVRSCTVKAPCLKARSNRAPAPKRVQLQKIGPDMYGFAG